MQQRALGPFTVGAMGLGCMNLSHAYMPLPPRAEAERVLLTALDAGVTHFDTAALYGFGANENLVGDVLGRHRNQITLASKCGLTVELGDGVVRQGRVIDGSPDNIRATCEGSLKRLKTDVIDLYYLHRWDKQVPIEDSVGAMAELVREGKIRAIGLSEVSAETLRKAHAVHPIAALQSEYSLWTREVEIAVLDTCRALGVTLVAFSPLGRGFLGGCLEDPAMQLQEGDIRLAMPRFEAQHYPRNLELMRQLRMLAAELSCSPAQLALAWLLCKHPDVLPIPGTRSVAHLLEDLAAQHVLLTGDTIARLDAMINQHTVAGERYNAATMPEVDTERFSA